MHILAVPFFLLPIPILAGSTQQGGYCNPANTHLNPSTYELTSDCDSTAYCAGNSTCLAKGCRRDEYPFGYENSVHIPPLCPEGKFCPDEEDACQALLPVGSTCQLNRDDECEPPPDQAAFASSRNTNGSICLNFACYWANVTAGDPCMVENTVYTGYYPDGSIFYDIVSRDNCITGTYCDGVTRTCINTATVGGACEGDKECDSYNCLASGVCGSRPDAPSIVPVYIYVVAGVGIVIAMITTSTTLFLIHRRERRLERQRRIEYWSEQETYRQTLAQMRRASLGVFAARPSGPSREGMGYKDQPSLSSLSKESWDAYDVQEVPVENDVVPSQRRRRSAR